MVCSVFRVFFGFFLGFFGFFLGFFGLFRNNLFRLFRFCMNRNKQKTHPNSLKESIFGYFSENLCVVSVCFGLLRNRSVCFGCFDIGSKHQNKPKFFLFGFTKQTETNAKQILFRFVSVRTENYFCLFRGHPTPVHKICNMHS